MLQEHRENREQFLKQFGKYKEISSYFTIPKKYHTPLIKSWTIPDGHQRFNSSYAFDHARWYKISSGWLCINCPYACWANLDEPGYENITKHEKLINEGWTHIPQKLYPGDSQTYYIIIDKKE